MEMKRHFGLRARPEVATELRAGAAYLIFAVMIVVVWLAFIHP
jgi:hypothetical protein